jgi:hypothetical protein
MAATQTTLNGAMAAGATSVVLTAYTAPALGTGVNAGNKVIRIDGEWMRITDDSLSPSLKVTRGEFGTQAVAHATLATAVYGLTSDMAQINSVQGANITSYGADGAIAIPTTPSNVPTLIYLDKATAGAFTLAAPGKDQDGLTLVITSNTAAAHVITATGLFSDGSTTTDVATFGAHKGASLTICAARGLWNVISSTQVSFT